MAALSSKLGAGVPTIGLLANKGRILAVGAVNLKVGRYTATLTAGIRCKYGGSKLVSRDTDGAGTRLLVTKFLITKFLSNKVPNALNS
jgi:hypothetical protein